jgi:hypothetical protein
MVPDPLQAMEDAAYEDVEEAAEQREAYYAKDGPAAYVKPYRPGVKREWPAHTDFRPDELEVRD